MSTRSGKRIHNSFHENIVKSDVEQVDDSVKKTRSRRLKQNAEEFGGSIVKSKKRTNYVTYPTDDEIGIDTADSKDEEGQPVRLLRKNVLRQQNLVISSVDSVEPPIHIKKAVKTTRRTRKYAEDTQENIKENQNNSEDEINNAETRKSKKEKKVKPAPEQVVEEVIISKKKTKKKKGKKVSKSSSMIVEDIEPQNGKNTSLNKSNMSVDSFHSAAGNPRNVENVPLHMVSSPQKDLELVNATFQKNDHLEKHVDKIEGRKTRSSTRLGSFNSSLNTPNRVVTESRKRKSSTKDLDKSTTRNVPNDKDMDVEEPFSKGPFKVSKKRKSSIMETVSENIIQDTTFDKETKNSTYDLEDLEKEKSIKNAATDLNNLRIKNSANIDSIDSNINTTYDKDDKSHIRESTETDIPSKENELSDDDNSDVKETVINALSSATKTQQLILNATFETSSSQIDEIKDSITLKPASINTTFEKETDSYNSAKPSINNTTFERDELASEIQSDTPSDIRRKSALLTSQKLSTDTFDKTKIPDLTFDKDKKLDTTFDKNSNSKLSILSSDNSNITTDKSDVSRISITSDDSKENIINTTPVLIESSLDESQLVTTKISPKSPAQVPLTPLKREGTFTKDGPEVVESPMPRLSKTPTKRMSLPSPGCTPFHVIKSVSKERSVLNVTRSIEKSRRSSLAEPLPRTTKVMFCSPVNNPAVVLQQRRKVIKSNLKGSNKSFVFEENESRPAPRKRSYTQSDADTARVKRKRLADGMQHSVDRLSRSRTTSASAKLTEPSTPSKKPVTPKKSDAKISRTKLPNFAALHQKEFAKMESLDECQERKAKRAKQLLTPTGAMTVLERSSPKENASEPQKSPNEPKEEPKEHKEKRSKESKKPDTPIKSLPTLKSLNPGYTRFGFKLNLDVNPFSIPSNNKTSSSNDSIFSFSNKKDSKAKTRLFSFSSKKDNSKKDNSKPLKDIRANLTRQATLPSMTGATSRREVAKQTVMREKSFTDRRNVNRNETRTIIKGVRTNRRFELQMRMRNID